MRFVTASLAVILIVTACTAAQVEAIDPTVYVPDVYCPDQNGHAGKEYPWTRLVAGNVCCSWQGMGAGQCGENESCMNVEDCSTPLPPNDAYGTRRVTKRRGLR